jgi:ribosomal protein S18 acetylase RimI-like enzyme
MPVRFELASADDVPDLVLLQNSVSEHMTARHGAGFWSSRITVNGLLFAMRHSSVYIARERERMVGTLSLSTRKPWAIERKYFSASVRPLYLTAMAVHPEEQRRGVGSTCIEEARREVGRLRGDAIRLDAWDAAAGAGDFYRKCGFREVGRAVYRGAALIYFEMVV